MNMFTEAPMIWNWMQNIGIDWQISSITVLISVCVQAQGYLGQPGLHHGDFGGDFQHLHRASRFHHARALLQPCVHDLGTSGLQGGTLAGHG